MTHLVQNGVGAVRMLRISCGRAENIGLGEGDQPRVFHCTQVIFGDEDGIVFGPRVWEIEILIEEIQPLLGDLQNLRIHMLRHGRPGPYAQLNFALAVGGAPRVALRHIRAGGERHEIGGQWRRGPKRHGVPVVARLPCGLGLIAERHPSLWHRHPYGTLCLKIRLIKARKNPARIGGLGMGV